MDTPQAGPMILAIGTRDDFLHVYPNEQTLLQDNTIGAGEGENTGPLEFFDSAGHRLTGEYDQQWRLRRLVPTTEPPDQGLVRQRLRNAVDNLRSFVKDNPDLVQTFDLTVPEALALLPDPGEGADGDASLGALFAAHLDRAHEPGTEEEPFFHITDDPIHNMKHAGGFRH